MWEKESERRIAGKRRVVMRAERASGGQGEFRVVVRASRLAVAAERAMHHGIA